MKKISLLLALCLLALSMCGLSACKKLTTDAYVGMSLSDFEAMVPEESRLQVRKTYFYTDPDGNDVIVFFDENQMIQSVDVLKGRKDVPSIKAFEKLNSDMPIAEVVKLVGLPARHYIVPEISAGGLFLEYDTAEGEVKRLTAYETSEGLKIYIPPRD